MYSSEDLERFYFQYQIENLPHGESLQSFCVKKLTVSSVRVKKFCATTQFDATKVQESGFKAPYTLGEGLARTLEFEFIHDASEGITFKSE